MACSQINKDCSLCIQLRIYTVEYIEGQLAHTCNFRCTISCNHSAASLRMLCLRPPNSSNTGPMNAGDHSIPTHIMMDLEPIKCADLHDAK